MLLLMLFLPDPLHRTAAQTPAPATPAAADPFQLYRLELQMAESGYELLKSNVTLSRYVAALESLAGPVCMPTLFLTYDYRGNPQDPQCLKLMQRLLELEPGNPLAVCIRDGIFAPACRLAYSSVIVESFSTFSSFAPVADSDLNQLQLTFKLANDTAREEVKKLEGQLQQLTLSRPAGTPAAGEAERLQKARALRIKMLRAACEISRLRLEGRAERSLGQRLVINTPTPRPATGGFKDTLSESIKKLREDKPTKGSASLPALTPSPAPDTLVHKRLITETCRATVQKFLNPPHSMHSARCYAVGMYSPDCISAILQEKKVESSSHTPAPGNTPAPEASRLFEEF